jgi:hypothetical protein
MLRHSESSIYNYISSENQCGYIYRNQNWDQNFQKMGSGYEHFHPKIDLAPLKAKEINLKYSVYCIRKNGFATQFQRSNQ